MLSLFSSEPVPNLLPYDGQADYYGCILDEEAARYYYEILMKDVAWRNDEAVIFGKKIITRRKVAWYGDHPFEYTYSNTTKTALPWLPGLLKLKMLVEDRSDERYNSCLMNLYHSGDEGMAWHSDGETDLKKNGAIASLSLGAGRKFAFKHKQTKAVVNVFLESGSLLVMKGSTQTHWLHRLPPAKRIFHPRINPTFRTIVNF